MLTVHFSLLHPHRFCPGSEQSAPGPGTNTEACQHRGGEGGGGTMLSLWHSGGTLSRLQHSNVWRTGEMRGGACTRTVGHE